MSPRKLAMIATTALALATGAAQAQGITMPQQPFLPPHVFSDLDSLVAKVGVPYVCGTFTMREAQIVGFAMVFPGVAHPERIDPVGASQAFGKAIAKAREMMQNLGDLGPPCRFYASADAIKSDMENLSYAAFLKYVPAMNRADGAK